MSRLKKLRDIQRFDRNHWERAHVALQSHTLLARVGNACLWLVVKLLTAAPFLRRLLTRRPKPTSQKQNERRWSSAVGAASAGLAPLTEVSRASLGRKILIVGELSLAQCRLYRVDHKLAIDRKSVV